jgi:hypothetical protein
MASDCLSKGQITYYTISDHRFFLGTVTLLNSLCLTKNYGDVVVLDAGLTEKERNVLAGRATIVDPTKSIEGNPTLMKPYPHMLEPSGTVMLIDSDMIVTGSLEHIRDLAHGGKICAYPNISGSLARWFPEWQTALGLRAPLRRQTYVNAGLVAFSTKHWPHLLARWWECCKAIPPGDVFTGRTAFYTGDQDALNALLMSEVSPGSLALLPSTEEAFGGTVKVDDFRTLACTSGDAAVRVLHFSDSPKPWERSGWLRVGCTDYVHLMRRLLFAADVPLRVDRSDVPLWLRPSLAGKLTLGVLGAANRTVLWFVDKIPKPLRERLRSIRRRLA